MNILDIANKFEYEGSIDSCELFGSGHINNTYLVKTSVKKYVLQEINSLVFKDIDGLMKNIFSVTSFLRDKIILNNGDPDRETLHFIKTKNGSNYYKTNDNHYFRSYVFVDNSICYDAVENKLLFEKSAIAFGKFQNMLEDFPANTLTETIPHFHDTYWRYENEFLNAVKNDSYEKTIDCKEEILFVNDRKNIMSKLIDLLQEGKIPLRVTHNDTKLNNVMFDETTNECICVIDLDTVMPGLALFDFGDSIRFGATSASEDEKDLSKVNFNIDYFESYVNGYLSQTFDVLNDYEKENLAFSAILMTLECGMRFLTDYLNGNIYFKTDYETHNLDRARNQFKLVLDMEKQFEKMNQIVREYKKATQ